MSKEQKEQPFRGLKKNNGRHRINVTFDNETFEKIQLISMKMNISMSELIRLWSMEALSGELGRENLDVITKIIREQIGSILQPGIERLAALGAKTCTMAATSTYLTAETISSFVPEHKQRDVEEVYNKARVKGVMYTKQKLNERGS